jgi:hypothetical protein
MSVIDHVLVAVEPVPALARDPNVNTGLAVETVNSGALPISVPTPAPPTLNPPATTVGSSGTFALTSPAKYETFPIRAIALLTLSCVECPIVLDEAA